MEIYLRKIELRDFQTFKKYIKDEEINKYTGFNIYREAEKSGFDNFLNRKDETNYAICLNKTNELIGDIGINKEKNTAEIGLTIFRKDLWGKGIGFKAICQLLELLKEDRIEKVVLDVNKQNERAKKLYKKLGFVTYKEDDDKYYMTLKL